AFSPDGKHILTSGDSTARLWDTKTGNIIWTFSSDTDFAMSGVAFSPDNKDVLMTSNSTIFIRDRQSGETIQKFVYVDFLTSVAYSPDGKYVLTGSFDKTVQLWELMPGK